MPTLRKFNVVPRLPASLERLRTLAYNLWWTWNHDARELFEVLDPELWERLHQNPVAMLARIPQRRLDEFGRDDTYLAAVDARFNAFERYMAREGWFSQTHANTAQERVAYFSMEFGLHECVPVYSGGLGVLAGDTLKTASDLGIPMIGVGIAYSEGYFRQALNDDGWQTERYPLNDWMDMPVTPVLDAHGQRVIISVPYPGREVRAQAWKVQVGRVPLYLLDANVDTNDPQDRIITNALYGGDNDHRIRQEILLGIGGIRLLEAIGLPPTMCHMNEGHSAFLGLERIMRVMADRKVSFEVAKEATSASNLFTTHTPVPAGIDQFDMQLAAKYLAPFAPPTGLSVDELLSLGRSTAASVDEKFSMPVLAIRLSRWHNAVSELHGVVSRKMWNALWPDHPDQDVPIMHVTNGVHAGSWTSAEMHDLLTRYLSPRWREECHDKEMWSRALQIPDSELWQVKQRRRMRLVRYCRQALRAAATRRGANNADLTFASEALDPDALTIGFARRFATYKRATLLFRDLARLERLVCNLDRPVQFVFAGKAHPHDDKGKDLIREIVHTSRLPQFRGHIVFLEDYDMGIARRLVSGVDVWLNTPRRPLEASGTSGMKAGLNGVLNASVLDGWWPEAWTADLGWAVGRGEEYSDTDYGDAVEAQALYQLLEDELVPTFYDRGQDRMPRRWIAMMKRSMATVGSMFNTVRMTREYAEKVYAPAIDRCKQMSCGNLETAHTLTEWKRRVRQQWPHVRVEHVEEQGKSQIAVGEQLHVSAVVALGGLRAEDVRVELYFGHLEGTTDLAEGQISEMKFASDLGDGRARFEGALSSKESGSHGFTVRVLPLHTLMVNPYETSLITWA